MIQQSTRYGASRRPSLPVLVGVLSLHLAFVFGCIWLSGLGGGGRLILERDRLVSFSMPSSGAAPSSSDAEVRQNSSSDKAATGKLTDGAGGHTKREIAPSLGRIPAGGAAGEGNPGLAEQLRNVLEESSAGDARIGDYRGLLTRHVARFLSYPPEASRRRLGGVVWVRFRVERDGTLADLVISTPGEPLLDSAALATVWRAEPVPSVPSYLEAPLEVEVPIRFIPPAPLSR